MLLFLCVQPKLLGHAILTPVRADGGRCLHDYVSVVLWRTSSHSMVIHAGLHRPVSGRSHRLWPAAVATSLAAVLRRLYQARHASSTTTYQLPAVLQLVRPTVRHRVSGPGCRRVPTADTGRLGEKATHCGDQGEVGGRGSVGWHWWSGSGRHGWRGCEEAGQLCWRRTHHGSQETVDLRLYLATRSSATFTLLNSWQYNIGVLQGCRDDWMSVPYPSHTHRKTYGNPHRFPICTEPRNTQYPFPTPCGFSFDAYVCCLSYIVSVCTLLRDVHVWKL